MPRKLLAVLVCAAAVVAVSASTAGAAAKTECNGTYTNTKLNGGVVVNVGDVCVLENVTVNGGLIVNGGVIDFFHHASLAVNNSTIHGQWVITGDVAVIGSNNGSFCGNDVDGGLTVHDALIGNSTFTGFGPLSFGELNAGCAGGTINGGASFTNVNSAGTELDGYTVNGGVTFANNTGFNEIEASSIHGSASCDAFSNVQNDNSGPGNNANSYTGQNNGCPA